MSTQGTGTTLVGGTSAFSFGLLELEGPEDTRGSVETSTMATTLNKAFEPEDLGDPGMIRGQGVYALGSQPPMRSALEVWTITPQGGAKTVAVSGYMTRHSPRYAINERMVFDFEIKCTGAITRAT